MKKRVLTALAVLTGIFLLSASIVWAQPAPVAKTGQTKCYADNGTEISCSGTFRDGDFQMGVPWPDPRFTDNGDGTVTDKLTGLMWAKDANLDNGTMPWNDAIDYANNLSLGSGGCGTNYTDWRLPNIKELLSLIDYGNYNVVLPSGHPFSNVQESHYWSSTTTETTGIREAWKVSLVDGLVNSDRKYALTVNGVWPVRGDTTSQASSYVGAYAAVPKTGQQDYYREGDDGWYKKGVDWPDPRFEDNGDGTVTDRLTGLMWAKDAIIGGSMYWDPAIDFVYYLSLGSEGCGGPAHTDWRLPNIKEQLSLIDYGNFQPALISDHPFSNVQDSTFYYTSTDYPIESMNSRLKLKVRTRQGKVYSAFIRQTPRPYFWPVRGGN
jgi:hypothetical protein